MKTKEKRSILWIIGLFIASLYIIYLYALNRSSNIIRIDDSRIVTQNEAMKIIEIVDKEGLYSNSKKWQESRTDLIEELKITESNNKRIRLLNDAISMTGGSHSALIIGDQTELFKNGGNDEQSKRYPETIIDENVLIIKMPECIGDVTKMEETSEYFLEYSDIIANSINENKNVDGIVIDLSENTGGAVYPMIGGLASLIPDETVIEFIDANEDRIGIICIENGYIDCKNDLIDDEDPGYQSYLPMKIKHSDEKVNKPVAIIIGDSTFSSGEITALAFDGLKNTKTFGKNTGGFTSGNETYLISADMELVITSSAIKTRTGEVFKNNPIIPDKITENPIDEAISWIKSYE